VAAVATAKETWERIVILPGLELFVRSNVSEHVRNVVSDIEARFAPSG
jgi:hypothetical protein